MGKSRILVLGGTGYLGKHVVKGSVKEGHPTFVLVRQSSDPAKKAIVTEFESLGATALYGDLNDHGSLVAALKQVDIVISVVGGAVLLDGQLKLIEAIKEVGHIKRFLPSEFGSDVDRTPADAHQALNNFFEPKRKIRRAVEKSGIPYTYVLNGGFAGFVLAPLAQTDIILKGFSGGGEIKPPREEITILGNGEGKIVTTVEDDIGVLAVKAADDPRALNKKLVIRPKPNTVPFNSVVALWEKKIGHSLHKTYLSKAEVYKQVDELSPPANFLLAVEYELLSGAEVFPLDPKKDVAADELFPDYKYITADEYLDQFV